MITLKKYSIMLLLPLLLVGCRNDDDTVDNADDGMNDPPPNSIVGKWEVISGTIAEGLNTNYFIFNEDDTVELLLSRTLGFKSTFSGNYTATDSELTLNLQGTINYSYMLNEDSLELTDAFGENLQLVRNNEAPVANEWVIELTVFSQGDAPWSEPVDFAFSYDKSQIIYGMSSSASYIPIIDPDTFAEIDQIPSTNYAKVVEVEKFPDPDRFLFQSDGDSDLVSYITMNDQMPAGSFEIVDQVSGLASENKFQIWVSNNADQTLNKYNYIDGGINTTVDIGIQTYGLDFQDGFLYINDGIGIHKCRISPSFQVVESFAIPDTEIFGLAFDGVSFWVAGYNDGPKLMMTNLTN